MRSKTLVLLNLLLLALPGAGGCVWFGVPVDIHSGPGRALLIADGETGDLLTDVTVLVERYRIEGPMHAAPVIVLDDAKWITPTPEEGYDLGRCIRWRQIWIVWMPEVRYSPARDVAAVKVVARGHETAWFAVGGPLDGLNVQEEARGRVLYLKPLRTPTEREAAIREISRHGWPPGPNPTMADTVVAPDIRNRLAGFVIASYQHLLEDFPDYDGRERVLACIERWRKIIRTNSAP